MRPAFLSLALTLGLLGACTRQEPPSQQIAKSPAEAAGQLTPSGASAVQSQAAAVSAPAPSGLPAQDLATDSNGLSKSVVVMKTTRGTLKFRLYPKDAPETVKRFLELVGQKFYNGLTFHRVVPGFIVQTGDPKSRNKGDTGLGTGGTGVKLRAEFNGRHHVKGTVGMARAQDPNSADSQFYITLNTFPHLDNNYTVFGQVIDFGEKVGGEDVLERLKQNDEIVEMTTE